MELRRLLIKLAFFLPLIAAIVAVNYWQDPAHLFHSAIEERIAGYLLEKKSIANVRNFNDRMVQKSYINGLTSANQVIALGSSRILQLRHENVCTENFFNHGVAYGSLPDLLAIYYNYYHKELIPKKVIIGVDPWFFNRNNNRIEWQIYKDDYNAMKAIISGGTLQQRSEYSYVLKQISSLISPSYFQESLKSLLAIKQKENQGIYVTDDPYPKEGMLRFDGQIVFSKEVREVSADQVNKNVQAVTHQSLYALGGFRQIDSDFKKEFELFIDFLIKQNTEVILLLAPYHMIMWDYISSSSEYQQIIKVMEYVQDLGQNKHVTVVGSYDPRVGPFVDEDFYDERHVKSSAFGKMFQKCKP